MTELEVKTQLKGFFTESLGVDGDILQDDSMLFGDEIGLDSIDSIELISFIDETFGVLMTGVAKEHFASVNSLAAYIMEHLA